MPMREIFSGGEMPGTATKRGRNLRRVLRFKPGRRNIARPYSTTTMKIPENIRPLLIPAAWLATAALTFGLGRLTSFVEAPPENHAAAAAPHSSPGAVSGSDAAGFGGSVREIIGASSAAATVEELTGGKPLDEWLKHLLAQDDDIARTTGFLMLLDKLNTPAEIEEALKAVHASGRNDWGGRSSREASMLLQKWTKLDPKSAMAYVQKIDDNRAKFGGMNTVLQTWARANPQEAVAWAKANGASETPAEGDRPMGNWAMASVLGQLSKTDLGQAIELAQTEPVSMARGRVIETLVNELVSQRGAAAAREAALAITDESMRAAMVRRLAGEAANSDPAQAVAWVAKLPAGAAKTSALAETVSQWARKDATAAATYMATLPAGAETDEPRASFARSVARTDPTGAIAWSNTITDPKARTQSLGEVVGSWMRSDADAAKKWVAASQLPAETKTEILAAAAQRGGDGFGGNTRGGRRGP